MNAQRLGEYAWASHALLAAVLDAEGAVRDANPTLERVAGRRLGGAAFAELIADPQRDAFARRLASAGGDWGFGTFALRLSAVAEARDVRVWLRRDGEDVLLVAEPDLAEQARLVEKVLELNDELVSAHRELVHQREELQRAADRIEHLEAISAAGLSNLDLDDLLRAVLTIIAEAVRADRAVLLLRDGDVLAARAAVGLEGYSLADICVPIGAGIAGRIAADNAPRVLPDLSLVEPYSAYLRETSRSMAGVPLRLEGEVIGVLHVTSDDLNRFGEDDLRLLVPAAERAALAIDRARIVERERRIAETLQRSLLPERLQTLEGLTLAARFAPGAGVEVGGDWYDALALPGGELAVVIGDVAGKGLRAATLMGELRAGLRAYAIEGGDPVRTLTRLNRLALRSFQMATVLLMHVDAGSGAMTYASAGHLPPLLVPASGPASFLAGGESSPLLAFREDVSPGEAALEPGARVVLYTDGLVERRREPIDAGLERLRAAAEGFEGDTEALAEHLLGALRPPPGAPHDDIALIVLGRDG